MIILFDIFWKHFILSNRKPYSSEQLSYLLLSVQLGVHAKDLVSWAVDIQPYYITAHY